MGQSGSQLLLRNHGEAIHAGMNQKTLESCYPRPSQRLNVGWVIRDNPAPGPPIDPAPASRRLALSLERGNIGGGRQAIQRHVHQQGISARCRGARGGLKPFPFRSAWIVDVHMGIDEPGKNRRSAEILRILHLSRHSIECHQVADSVAFHKHGRWTHPFRCHYPAGEEGAQTHRRKRVSRQSLLRLRQEGSPLSIVFQLAKIDNSTRKKCCPTVLWAYTCSPARASAWLFRGGWETVEQLASRIAREGSIAIRHEQSFHGTCDSALDRRGAIRPWWPVRRSDRERRKDHRRGRESSHFEQ